MKGLHLGGICSNFSCALCCIDTEMILSQEDVSNVCSLNFVFEDFAFVDEQGFIRLRNINGKCYFLNDKKCSIYEHRPAGCKFYPIIFDLQSNKAIIDPDCPLAKTINPQTIKLFDKPLQIFVKKLLKENKKRE